MRLDMPIDLKRAKSLIAQARGLVRALPSERVVTGDTAEDLNRIIRELTEAGVSNVSGLSLTYGHGGIRRGSSGATYCDVAVVRSRAEQLIALLESELEIDEPIIQIGVLFNAIKDPELQSRCGDLLTSKGPFDRAINQATQVLEHRIRTRAERGRDRLQGLQLINEVLTGAKTRGATLKISDDRDEQEGFAELCRGMVRVFRNETHHRLSEAYDREEALKVCAFIDNLLDIINNAVVIEAGKEN